MNNSTFFIWTYVLYLFKIINQILLGFFPLNHSLDVENLRSVIKSPTELYYEKHLNRFLGSFAPLRIYNAQSVSPRSLITAHKVGVLNVQRCKTDKKWNSNIDDVFYNKEKYLELLKDVDNELEKKWKMRILIEHTPRGNVFMFYDPYKLGFSYYCDQYVPYNILNGVAMKYVLKFYCRDFFMDEYVVPETVASPLLGLLVEEKKTKEIQEKMDSNIKNRLRNAPFAKFKNYNRATLQTNGEENKKECSVNVPCVEKQKERNRFINLGKTSNFCILQPCMKKKRRYSNMFKSKLANSLFDNSSVQKEVFSYRQFKNGKL